MQHKAIDLDAPSVQSYLGFLQAVIERMANHSAACKTWCVSLVSAIVVVVADKAKADYVWIGAIPLLLFFVLDSYYLCLERQFRGVYSDFIRKLHFDCASMGDVFFLAPRDGVAATSWQILQAAVSLAIWPFYVLLGIMLVVIRAWVL